MKTPDKQWSQQKDKDRNKAERDKMRKRAERAAAVARQGGGQQGGWDSDQDKQKDMGRKPPIERDRDYDPDGDRVGRTPIERP